MARCEGEHLECSPCGRAPVVNSVIIWLGPEVLLSLLPKTTGNYSRTAIKVSFRACNLSLDQIPQPGCECERVS